MGTLVELTMERMGVILEEPIYSKAPKITYKLKFISEIGLDKRTRGQRETGYILKIGEQKKGWWLMFSYIQAVYTLSLSCSPVLLS